MPANFKYLALGAFLRDKSAICSASSPALLLLYSLSFFYSLLVSLSNNTRPLRPTKFSSSFFTHLRLVKHSEVHSSET